MNLGLKAVNARIVVCIIAILMPAVLVISTGIRLDSYSQYFYTPIGPFFVGVLSLTCYMMFSHLKWIPSAIALAGVIMFPCDDYAMVHNISAVMFFIFSAIAVITEKQDQWLGYLMIASSPVVLYDLFIAEVILVSAVSVFHILRLLRVRKLLLKMEDRHQ